jgi:hypothetical protein
MVEQHRLCEWWCRRCICGLRSTLLRARVRFSFGTSSSVAFGWAIVSEIGLAACISLFDSLIFKKDRLFLCPGVSRICAADSQTLLTSGFLIGCSDGADFKLPTRAVYDRPSLAMDSESRRLLPFAF